MHGIYDRVNGGYRLLAETTLSPGNSSFVLPAVKTDSLLIEIANDDNQPLIVQAVQTAQLNQYLLTWLQAGSGIPCWQAMRMQKCRSTISNILWTALPGIPQEILSGPLEPVNPAAGCRELPRRDQSGYCSGVSWRSSSSAGFA